MRISGLFVPQKTKMYVRQLYYGNESDRRIRLLGKEKAALFFGIVIISVIVSIPVFVTDGMRLDEPLTNLKRNEYGQGQRTVSLRSLTDDGQTDRIKIDVDERKYTDAELAEFSEKLDEELWKDFLGSNSDPENVMYDLNFMKKAEGFPFEISWKSDRPLILSSSGKINEEKLAAEDPEDEGVVVGLCATLRYNDYSEDKYSHVVVRKKPVSSDEAGRDIILRSIKESDTNTETYTELKLPEYAAGHRIVFFDAAVNRGWIVLFTGVVTACFLMAVKDGRIKDEAEKRRKQMDIDYPGILNQYMLYYMAGMNPRAIWTGICKRYEDGTGKGRRDRRYAYEEMLTTRNRMDEGCGELTAYDEFAMRCDNVRYRAFVSFVKQAVVKGNDGLYDILYQEMDKAQREKNNRIKMEASEAQTKLLLPMFMMLSVVLVIVMIPALIGLNG